jgi:hypothetical protein
VGSRIAISSAIMAITTKSSINVKPFFRMADAAPSPSKKEFA